MSYQLWASLRPEDRRNATRNSAGACLLAQALTRQYGGEWSVSGSSITQTIGDDVTWDGRTTVAGQGIILRYDTTATAKTGRRVMVATARRGYGTPKRAEGGQDGPARGWGQKPYLARNAGLAAAGAGSAFLFAEGLEWVVFAGMGGIAAVLGTSFARNVAAHRKAAAAGSVAGPGKQMYARVHEPAGQPAEAQAREEAPAYDDGLPEPVPAGPAEAPAFSEPAPAGTRSENLYDSGPPAQPAHPDQAAAPAPESVPAPAGEAA